MKIPLFLYDVKRSGEELLQPMTRALGALRRGCMDSARVKSPHEFFEFESS